MKEKVPKNSQQEKVTFPIIKVFLQKNCQGPVFTIDFKYSRHDTFPGTVFPRGTNNRKDLLGELAKGIEEHISKNRLFSPMINIPLQNNFLKMQKITLQKIKNCTKNLQPGYTLWQILLFL